MTQTVDPDALLDQRQVSRMLNVKPKMLEGRRYRGGGPPYITIGKLVRYRRSDVLGYLEANRRTVTPHVPRLPRKKKRSSH